MEEYRFEMNDMRDFICKVLLMAYAFGLPFVVLGWGV